MPNTVWQVAGSGAATQNYTVTGDEVDLLVRTPKLGGSVASSWNDVDGDRYASAGDTVTYSYAVTNTGNVALTDLWAPGIGLSQPALAVGDTANLTTTYTLTDADVAAKQLPAISVPVSAHNGSKSASVQLTQQPTKLNVQPAKPAWDPALASPNLIGKAPPVDLGLGSDKYRPGQTVTIHNVQFGQWYYAYLNKRAYRLGWFFPSQQNAISFVLPDDVRNGMDTLVVLDSEGHMVSFGDLHVTPFGSK